MSYDDNNDVVLLENESKSNLNRLHYSLSIMAEQSNKNTSSVHDFFAIESIDNSLVNNDSISKYTSFESITPISAKEKLTEWIKIAIEKLIQISKSIYEFISRCITNIIRIMKHGRNTRDYDTEFKQLALKNNIRLSIVSKIERVFQNTLATDIKPIKLGGVPHVFKMIQLKNTVDQHYCDSLFCYYTDSNVRATATEIKNRLVKCIQQSSTCTKGFIDSITIISKETIPPGGLFLKVQPLKRFIPDQKDITINSALTFYSRSNKESADSSGDCLKWVGNFLRSGKHTKKQSSRSKQSLQDISSITPYLDSDLFANDLEIAANHLRALSDNKMAIFRTTGDADIPGVKALLVIDEQIRKYTFAVYHAVSIINIISILENSHMMIKEAIYNQKLSMLYSFCGVKTN